MLKKMVLAGVIALCGGAASAASVGFQLDLSGNFNVPTIGLTNISDSGIQITGFSITIGRSGRTFDFISSLVAPAGGTATIVTGDTANSGPRTTSLVLSYTGFDTGETSSFDTDVDTSGNTSLDYRTTFFNNGASEPNSLVSVMFSNSESLDFLLPDDENGLLSAYTFRMNTDVSAVPLPAGLPLLLVGLAAFGMARAKKGRS